MIKSRREKKEMGEDAGSSPIFCRLVATRYMSRRIVACHAVFAGRQHYHRHIENVSEAAEIPPLATFFLGQIISRRAQFNSLIYITKNPSRGAREGLEDREMSSGALAIASGRHGAIAIAQPLYC